MVFYSSILKWRLKTFIKHRQNIIEPSFVRVGTYIVLFYTNYLFFSYAYELYTDIDSLDDPELSDDSDDEEVDYSYKNCLSIKSINPKLRLF